MSLEGFDWDHDNWAKCQQHGVSIEEIETALTSGAMLILPDIKHADEEDRLIATGRSFSDRHMFVVFTLRQRKWPDSAASGRRPPDARAWYMHKEGDRHPWASACRG